MTTKKILCPTDFSEGSKQAIRLAARLASQWNAELVLVHSWFIPTIAYSMEAPFPPYAVTRIVEDAQHNLDAAVRDAIAAGAKTATGTLLNGTPWHAIVSELENKKFELCVIGTHGRTGLSRILLGSVAEKVIRHAPCSVLAVRPDSTIGEFHHVLVPTDFSDSAANALDVATRFVAPTGAISVMHVLEPAVGFGGVMPPELAQSIGAEAVALLQAAAASVQGVRVTVQSRIGYPGAQTLAAIDEDRSIDLVVMGSHGRTGIARALLGSVAEKVVRHARCPVLVTRKAPSAS
jgi:nucleotide-binding universal stress UspA family protein